MVYVLTLGHRWTDVASISSVLLLYKERFEVTS
jgi:hypothetical protein